MLLDDARVNLLVHVAKLHPSVSTSGLNMHVCRAYDNH